MRASFHLTGVLAGAAVLAAGLSTSLEAQYRSARPVNRAASEPRFEIAVFGGYQFGGKWDVLLNNQPGTLDIADHGSYGMAFDVRVRPGVLTEFLYIRQPTTLYFQPLGGVRGELFPMHVAYYQLGGLYEVPQGRFRPFAGLGVGGTHFNPKEAGRGSEWRFSTNVSVGFRAFVTERVGLRGQFHLLIPFQWSGGGMFCGGGGCSIGVSGGSAIVQGMVSGGLVIGL
jgi:hypothetical protein